MSASRPNPVVRAWRQLGLSGRILVGLCLGILTGLFIGEPAAVLKPIGTIYIRLMQMTVLPYLVTALVIGLGSLEAASARRMAKHAGLMLLVIWAIMCVVLFALPLAFPEYVSATFYSSALVEPPQSFSLAEIYFTPNMFEALSSNLVPAVVLFSCIMGVALMGLDDKADLLRPLQVWNRAIVNITRYVIALTPIGVFAIAAETAGTMSGDTLIRLEAYFVAFIAATLLLCFIVLPLLVTAVTPFRYREVVGIARDALITAFVTHSAFIVLPILVQRSKELMERHGLLSESTDATAEVTIPVLFNFPTAGKLITLLFVPFAAWLSGAALAPGQYPELFAAGIPSYFAKAQIALPYLLDLFGLPHDLFRLYIPTTIITGKFDSMLAAMNLLVFALLGSAAMGGFLVFRARRIARAVAIMAASLAATVVLVRLLLAISIDTEYHLDETVLGMHALSTPTEIIVHDRRLPPPGAEAAGPGRLDRARARGSLRFGYDPDNLPFSFINEDDELVGFDIEIAGHLAAALDLKAEFIPIDWPEIPAMLANGEIDLMPGVWYRPNWFGQLQMSEPYLVGTMALATRDERRHEFARIEDIRDSRGLVIGIPLDQRQVAFSMRHYFGGADVEFRVIEFWDGYFRGEHPELDAFLMPAEHASGWSLLHPEYTVVVPQPNPVKLATGFGMAPLAHDLAEVVNEWTVFARHTGGIDSFYDYWVLGQGADESGPRWSILRDVLGWGADPENED